MIKLTILLLSFSLMGCAVTAEKYSIEKDGVKKDVLKVSRGGEAEYPNGSKIKGSIWEWPQLPPIKVDAY